MPLDADAGIQARTALHLLAPGSTPAGVLFPEFEAALASGRSVWYLVPNRAVRARRLRRLARALPLLDPPLGTLEDYLRARSGDDVARPPDARLVRLLLRDAIARAWPEVRPGAGLVAAARGSIEALLYDGWTPASLRTALERMEARTGATDRLATLWSALDEVYPEADVAKALRDALGDDRLVAAPRFAEPVGSAGGEAGGDLFQDDPPELLLIEGGPLRGELDARALARLVEAVRGAGGRVVATALDVPTSHGPHGRAARLLKDLLRVEPSAPDGDADDAGSAPDLRHLARNLFRQDADAPPPPPAIADSIVRLTAPDDWTTADLVAREILALLRQADSPEALLRRGIAVVCPTAADRETAERVFHRYALPVAATPHEPMAEHPGGRFLLFLLDFLRLGAETPLDVLLALVASDGWGLAPAAVDRLARRLQLRGALTAGDALAVLEAWPRRAAAGDGERPPVNDGRAAVAAATGHDGPGRAATLTRERLRRLLALHAAFQRTRSSAERSALLHGVLKRRWARDALHWVVDPRRGAWRRHGARGLLDGHEPSAAVRGAAGYARPLRRLDDLLALLDDCARRTGREVAPGEWLSMLREQMEAMPLQLGSAPALGIRLERPGDVPEPADVVFVLGLVERRFPRAPRQDPFLPDAVRRALAQSGDLRPPRQAADDADAERERFLLSCGAARRRLYLCHPRTDGEGKEVLPSFFLEDVARALGLPGAAALPNRGRRLGEVVARPAACGSAAELRIALAAALRDPELGEHARLEVRRGVDHLLRSDGAYADALLARFSDGRARIVDPEHRRFLAEKADRLSASQLRTYDHCAFQHFVEGRLEPQPIRLPTFDPLRRGGIVHDLLWRFGVEWRGWEGPEPALARIGAAALPASEPSVAAGHRAAAAWATWRDMLLAFLARELGRLEASEFRPDFHELTFGEREGPRDPRSCTEPVALDVAGEVVRFSGSIDRVDTRVGDDGCLEGVAIDYKTGKKDYRKAIETGDELQVLLYLRVLEAFGIEPAGALYLSVVDGGIAGVVREDAAARLGELGRGVIVAVEEEWRRLREQADQRIAEIYRNARTPIILARPKDWKCWPCEWQGLCRTHVWRAKRDA